MPTDDLTIESLGLRPDARLDRLVLAAQQTADLLSFEDRVEVAFAPGDATQYQLLIVNVPTARAGIAPFFTRTDDNGLLVVPLNLSGQPMVWNPGRTYPGKVLGRLTDHEHTATVYAAFLSLLAAELAR